MTDPLVEMMREVTGWKPDSALENEAAELSSTARESLEGSRKPLQTGGNAVGHDCSFPNPFSDPALYC